MKCVNEKDLQNNMYIGYGSYGETYKIEFNDSPYAYKKFYNSKFLKGRIKKLELISKVEKDYLVRPLFWVVDDSNNKIGYLTEYINGRDLAIVDDDTIDKKIITLKDCKEKIIDMNESGIIHGDLSKSNIMIANNEIKFIDFDNSTYNNYYTDTTYANGFQSNFIKKYGINKELDIYSFNLITFSMINNVDAYKSRKNILIGDYGLFSENLYAMQICESLLLDSDTLNTNYLIDTIDDTKFSI